MVWRVVLVMAEIPLSKRHIPDYIVSQNKIVAAFGFSACRPLYQKPK
jgi:hypothetical protein